MEYVFPIYAKIKCRGMGHGILGHSDVASITMKTNNLGIGFFVLAWKFLITGMQKIMRIG